MTVFSRSDLPSFCFVSSLQPPSAPLLGDGCGCYLPILQSPDYALSGLFLMAVRRP